MTWQERLQAVLSSWRGTPYMAGQSTRGVGVDCRYFVVGVLDELYGITSDVPNRRNPHTAQWDRRAAVDSVREIVSRYPCEVLREDVQHGPGDVLLCRRPGTRGLPSPAHVMIAGILPGELWHAGPSGVGTTGLGLYRENVIRTWRMGEKESWSS